MRPLKLTLAGFHGVRDGMRRESVTLDLTTLPNGLIAPVLHRADDYALAGLADRRETPRCSAHHADESRHARLRDAEHTARGQHEP